MVKVDAVSDLLSAAESFTIALREGFGLNESAFEELCSALRSCAHEWADQDHIPKTAANVLVDLFPAIESCSYLAFYRDEEAQRIRDAAMTISDLVRACVALNGQRL